MQIHDLGLTSYRDAWAIQESAHQEVVNGGPQRIFIVEHPPVITYGRRPGVDKNLLATEDQLRDRGVDIVQSDRGGDITFHGPGQLVVYPVIRLADHRLSVSGYVHLLEALIIDALKQFGVAGNVDPAAVGVWAPDAGCSLAKVCAIGIRIRRGVTLHGLALNVTTDLNFFKLIVPCGLTNRPVTSLEQLLPGKIPSMQTVKAVVTQQLQSKFASPLPSSRAAVHNGTHV